MPSLAGVTVGGLIGSLPEGFGLPIELLAGSEGLDRVITSPHVQKTGLALVGLDEYLKPGRILVLGESETRYLDSLQASERTRVIRAILTRGLPCVVVTGEFLPSAELAAEAERAGVPLIRTTAATPTAVSKLTSALEDSLGERTIMHAVLMDILGLGVLIVGESGIGKSECALDLIVRGHRLVADDTVEIRRRSETILVGTCPELTRHHMELRGLGVVNVKDLFGIASTRSSKRVELVVRLERWEEGREYDRLGLDDHFFEILGLNVPYIQMPVAPGRNVATLVEVAARNQLLRLRGHHGARAFADRVADALRRGDGAPADDPNDEEEEIESGGLR